MVGRRVWWWYGAKKAAMVLSIVPWAVAPNPRSLARASREREMTYLVPSATTTSRSTSSSTPPSNACVPASSIRCRDSTSGREDRYARQKMRIFGFAGPLCGTSMSPSLAGRPVLYFVIAFIIRT